MPDLEETRTLRRWTYWYQGDEEEDTGQGGHIINTTTDDDRNYSDELDKDYNYEEFLDYIDAMKIVDPPDGYDSLGEFIVDQDPSRKKENKVKPERQDPVVLSNSGDAEKQQERTEQEDAKSAVKKKGKTVNEEDLGVDEKDVENIMPEGDQDEDDSEDGAAS